MDAQIPRSAEITAIPEVVVTARRIEENLQAVPVSIQAIPGELLEETGITRLFDLQFAVPGLVVNTVGMFGAGFSLRGISDQRVAGFAVAPHLNGVYLGNANLAISRMFDLERVEVLKGPQSALYGRNASAGSMDFITRSPQEAFSADVEASYASFDTTRAQGHVNLPVHAAALRIAFIASEGDGYIRNTVDSRTFGEEDFWGLRAALRVETSEGLSLDVMAQHVRDDGASAELWTPQLDFLVDPNDIRLTTVTLANPYLVSEIDNFNINFQYDFGFATLRSITGYARSNVRNLDDCAANPFFLQGCVRGGSPVQYDQWSQELQLVFSRKDSVEGLVGAYFADAEEYLHFYQTFPVVSPLPFNDFRATSEKPAAAVFGQATLHMNEGWSSTAGVRLSWEELRMTSIGTGLADIPPVVAGEDEWSNVSWRLDLQRAVSEDLMYYASVATGYKSGGIEMATSSNGEVDTFDPEYVTAYELGAKTQWLDRRLTFNAAAFFNDFDELQVTTTDFSQNPPATEVANAARAEVYGLDVEIEYQASDLLSVTAGAVWLPKREFVRFFDEAGNDLAGNELVRAPEWTATGAITYERPLHSGALSARLEYNYRGGYFYTSDNDPQFAQEDFGLLNLFLRFESANESWYLFASGRNLTDEDYFTQVFIQTTPGYPDTYEVGVGYRF